MVILKKLILTVGVAVFLVIGIITPAYASSTFYYDVSSTNITASSDNKASIKITIPAPNEAYAGIQFAISLPNGASFDVDGVIYDTSQGDPIGWQQAPSTGEWYFSRFSSSNVFSEQIVCTVNLVYTATSPGIIVIEEIKQIRIETSAETNTRVGNKTSITINPYSGQSDPTTFAIAATASPQAGGTVGGAGTYKEGETVILTATPANRFKFVGWYKNSVSGESLSTLATYSFSAESSLTLIALFEDLTVRITISASPAEGGTVTGGGDYSRGDAVKLTAAPNSGYRFTGWFSGSTNESTSTIYTFEATTDRSLVAQFTTTGNSDSGGAGSGGGGSGGGGSMAKTSITDIPGQETPQGMNEPQPGEIVSGQTKPVLDKNRTEGYIYGYPDGAFRPNNNITRYEAASIFYTLIADTNKANYKSGVAKFSDVPADQWFSESVGYLVAVGVLSGYPDGTFNGNNTITRAEFVTIASQFGVLILDDEKDMFPDVSRDHWAFNFIKSAFNNSWISGYPDGTFGPERNITRAEAVVIINRVLEWDSASAQGENPFSDVVAGEWYYNDVLLAANGK